MTSKWLRHKARVLRAFHNLPWLEAFSLPSRHSLSGFPNSEQFQLVDVNWPSGQSRNYPYNVLHNSDQQSRQQQTSVTDKFSWPGDEQGKSGGVNYSSHNDTEKPGVRGTSTRRASTPFNSQWPYSGVTPGYWGSTTGMLRRACTIQVRKVGAQCLGTCYGEK